MARGVCMRGELWRPEAHVCGMHQRWLEAWGRGGGGPWGHGGGVCRHRSDAGRAPALPLVQPHAGLGREGLGPPALGARAARGRRQTAACPWSWAQCGTKAPFGTGTGCHGESQAAPLQAWLSLPAVLGNPSDRESRFLFPLLLGRAPWRPRPPPHPHGTRRVAWVGSHCRAWEGMCGRGALPCPALSQPRRRRTGQGGALAWPRALDHSGWGSAALGESSRDLAKHWIFLL